MDDYKIAFIYGNAQPDKNIHEGEIHYYGESEKDYIHNRYLLDYVKEYHSDVAIFNQLNLRHPREVVAYFLVKMGHIVFFNTTQNDEKYLKKYGKTGQFMMPDNPTEKQLIALENFCKEINEYDIIISHNITLTDGMLDSQTIQSYERNEPIFLVNEFKSKLNDRIK